MEKIYFNVSGIGRVHLVQECGANLIVEDESGTRLSLPASRCTVSDQTAAALADQFTGEDLGAQMASAEGFNHSQQVASVGHAVFTAIGEGVVEWVAATPGGWVYGVRAKDCPNCRQQLLMGDAFEREPSLFRSYRVGDAHEGGEV